MVDYGIARAKVLDTIVDAIKWEAPCLRSAAEQEDARRPIRGRLHVCEAQLSRRTHGVRSMEEVSKRFAAAK